MKNVSKIFNCYGCGVCSIVCSRNIIRIELNKDGFYEPRIIDLDRCTNCGLCTDVCAYSHEELALGQEDISIKSWGAWSNDERVQHKCSSGGIGYEIVRQLIEKDYKLCGCRYNAKEGRAEHYIAVTPEEAIQSIGSKYIQSYTAEAFKAINRKEKYVVTGTPCQIDSFRHYIKKFRVEDNFILLDFFCHAVPSMWAWKKYIQLVEHKIGKITYASWRNKFTGWHDSWAIALEGENIINKLNNYNDENLLEDRKTDYYSRWSQGDLFYTLFLGDYCCNPACVKNCKYKYNRSSADIRIGDLWGKTYQNNEKGVSALVALTKRGQDVIHSLGNVTLIEHPFEVVAEGQMKHNAGSAILAFVAKKMLNSEKGYSLLQWKLLLKCEALFHLPTRIINKIKFIASR